MGLCTDHEGIFHYCYPTLHGLFCNHLQISRILFINHVLIIPTLERLNLVLVSASDMQSVLRPSRWPSAPPYCTPSPSSFPLTYIVCWTIKRYHYCGGHKAPFEFITFQLEVGGWEGEHINIIIILITVIIIILTFAWPGHKGTYY